VAGSDFVYFIPGAPENETTNSSIAAMTRHIILIGLVTLTLTAITASLCRRAPMEARAQDAAPIKRPAEAIRGSQLQGSQSCATAVCHGGAELHERRSEFTTWLSLDPHARAYDTLLGPQSQAIAKNLWAGKAVAHEAPQCLKCHVGPSYDHARPNFRRQDGVGCESCHGAAESWLHDHYRPGWQRRGMSDTKSLPGRARACVDCHVGARGNEVDHDLIAAGHPALRFEFATYFADLPRHWKTSTDQATPDFEARAWFAGQVVSAGQAMELLAHRADPSTGKIWPEFAEFDCFACHHDLQVPSWRQKMTRSQPGSLRRSDWYTAMLPDILLSAKAVDAVKLLDGLREAKPSTILGRKQLVADAKSVSKLLLEIEEKPANVNWLDRLRVTPRADRNWDEATQRYLALLSLRPMHKDDAALNGVIDDLRKRVNFDRDRDSPHRYEPERR
jgi:hypothetical protein